MKEDIKDIKVGNQKPWIEEVQTIHWPKERWQIIIYKILHRKLKLEQYEPTKTGDELRFYGRISSSCSTSDNRRATVKRN